MALQFVDILTVTYNSLQNKDNPQVRQVRLDFHSDTGEVFLSGGLLHMTQILVDQDLVDQLQEIVNEYPMDREEQKWEITKGWRK